MDGNRIWDRQHQNLYHRLKKDDEIELLKKLIRYRNPQDDEHLSKYPSEMIEKTIYVIEHILTKDLGIADIDQAIANAKKFGVI